MHSKLLRQALLIGVLVILIPFAKRLFFVRPTNVRDLEAYQAMGFVKDLNQVQDPNHKINTDYLTPLEYSVENSNIL